MSVCICKLHMRMRVHSQACGSTLLHCYIAVGHWIYSTYDAPLTCILHTHTISCICTSMCTYLKVYTYIYILACICTSMCTYLKVYTYIYTCMHACMHATYIHDITLHALHSIHYITCITYITYITRITYIIYITIHYHTLPYITTHYRTSQSIPEHNIT